MAESFQRERVFINCSNHPSVQWGEEQKKAAANYGKIVDYPFPEVDPSWTTEQIYELAEQVCGEMAECHPAIVMCQGEFTLAFAIISRLKAEGIPVVAACSRRSVEEVIQEDGSVQKQSSYHFEGFREY